MSANQCRQRFHEQPFERGRTHADPKQSSIGIRHCRRATEQILGLLKKARRTLHETAPFVCQNDASGGPIEN